MGSQRFLSSFGCSYSFVGSVIIMILINIKQVIVYRFVGIRWQGLPMKDTNIGPLRRTMIQQ